MSVQDIADFEAQLTKLCEFWRAKMTHAELVGTLDTVRINYHVQTILSFRDSEQCETPVIKEEQATAPVEGEHVLDEIARKEGSPLPAEAEGGISGPHVAEFVSDLKKKVADG